MIRVLLFTSVSASRLAVSDELETMQSRRRYREQHAPQEGPEHPTARTLRYRGFETPSRSILAASRSIARIWRDGFGMDVVNFTSVVCNGTTVNDVQFDRSRAIHTLQECDDLADELQKPFEMSSGSSSTNAQRCFMNSHALVFGATDRSPSTFLCAKLVKAKCETHAYNLCYRRDDFLFFQGLFRTPFRKLDSADNAETQMAQQLFRRTCKTEFCNTQSDIKWCCDQKMRHSFFDSPYLSDVKIAYFVGRSRVTAGYDVPTASYKSDVFQAPHEDGKLINIYIAERRADCSAYHCLVKTSSERPESSMRSCDREDSWSASGEVSPDIVAFVKASEQFVTERRRTSKERCFLQSSEVKGLTVVQNTTECLSGIVRRISGTRPMYTAFFLSHLRQVQQAAVENEETQKQMFRRFVQEFGLHAVVEEKFGGSSRQLVAKNPENANRLFKCREGSYGPSASVEVTGSLGSGCVSADLTKDQNACTQKNIKEMYLENKESENSWNTTIGSCECGSNGRNSATEMEKSVVISITGEPIFPLLQESLYKSSWFKVFHFYDAKTINKFFKRWEPLNYVGWTTCFLEDRERYPRAEAARRKCYENQNRSNCQLEICSTKLRKANATRIYSRCQGANCDDFCCMAVAVGEECSTSQIDIPPQTCDGYSKCVTKDRYPCLYIHTGTNACLCAPTCNDYTCESAYQGKVASKADDICDNGICDDAQCCGVTCSSYKCTNGFIKDLTRNTKLCANGNCSNLECCKECNTDANCISNANRKRCSLGVCTRTYAECDINRATAACACVGSATNFCAIGETCNNTTGVCSAPSCAIPDDISTLINNALSSTCGTTLEAGATCVVTCSNGYIASESGTLECSRSMGTRSKVPACTAPGVATKAIIYVQSKIGLTVGVANSAELQTSAFMTVMRDSIAASLNVTKTDVEMISVSLVTNRRLASIVRRLAEASVNIEFRVKAANSATESELKRAINLNKDNFTIKLSTEIPAKSALYNITLTVRSVSVDPANTTTIYQPVTTQAPPIGVWSTWWVILLIVLLVLCLISCCCGAGVYVMKKGNAGNKSQTRKGNDGVYVMNNRCNEENMIKSNTTVGN
eukprot:GEMP01003493.1.p1 GENE.GEMP01003493.1~~GEMP01003493.1.p1  ORF type:complete len:1099 (-),score=63.59 GEMP01003493.1:1144-4440(-)